MQSGVEAYFRKEHGDRRVLLETPEDVDAMIDSLLGGSNFENLAELHCLGRELLPSGFPDHELLVGANPELQVGVLEFMDADGNVVSRGSLEGRGEVPYFIVGNPTEFPEYSEIPIALVRQAVKEFLASGGQRPTCIEWQVPESW